MNKYTKRNQFAGLATVLMAAFPMNALAQDAISFLNEANTQVRSAGSIIYQLVIAVLAIIAIVSLITVGIKLYSGDQESAKGRVFRGDRGSTQHGQDRFWIFPGNEGQLRHTGFFSKNTFFNTVQFSCVDFLLNKII